MIILINLKNQLNNKTMTEISRTMKNRISKKQRIECFKRNLSGFLKEYQEYEKSKVFPNNFKRPSKKA